MGIDTIIAILDTSLNTTRTAADAEEYEAFVDLLQDNEEEFSLPPARHESQLSAIKDLDTFMTELESPPAVNEVDLYSVIWNLYSYPFVRPSDFSWLSLQRNNTVMGVKVPEFLDSRSPEAAGLWCKLMGRWEQASQFETIQPPYEFHINDETYRITPKSGVGFLQGGELGRLSNELRPHLSEAEDFYESLQEKYRSRAMSAVPLELIFALSSFYSNSHHDSIIFTVFE